MSYRVEFVRSAAKSYRQLDPVLPWGHRGLEAGSGWRSSASWWGRGCGE
ncbi:MAG: hypothetical protein ACH34U_03770 [Cyanobium sp.]